MVTSNDVNIMSNITKFHYSQHTYRVFPGFQFVSNNLESKDIISIKKAIYDKRRQLHYFQVL